MRRATEALHTVQSNAAARIRVLEEAHGTNLSRRHARGVEFISTGRHPLPYAQSLLSWRRCDWQLV